jgi:hypothetical protein
MNKSVVKQFLKYYAGRSLATALTAVAVIIVLIFVLPTNMSAVVGGSVVALWFAYSIVMAPSEYHIFKKRLAAKSLKTYL